MRQWIKKFKILTLVFVLCGCMTNDILVESNQPVNDSGLANEVDENTPGASKDIIKDEVVNDNIDIEDNTQESMSDSEINADHSESVSDNTVDEENEIMEEEVKQISFITEDGQSIVFELNDSLAAKQLYDQLPLTIEIEDFSTNEKVFYPPTALDVTDTPQAGGSIGTLAYYAPWSDVVLFYDSYQPNTSLYELGQVISNGELIRDLKGTLQLQAVH